MTQTYTSAKTSINKDRLPSIYTFLQNHHSISSGKAFIDYGCGRYTDHLQKASALCEMKSIEFFDKFNGIDTRSSEKYDSFILSNVLNVIDDDATIDGILEELSKIATDGIIKIYEGDHSGQGRPTADDCYQRNEKTSAYLDRVKAYFPNSYIKYGFIFAC